MTVNSRTVSQKTKIIGALGTLFFSAAALAQLSAVEPWARATVPAQKAAGAFVQLKSEKDAVLLGAETSAAGVVEIHEMRMDGDMMRMRQIGALKLPAGQTVSLQPGGYHFMLLDLKQPLNPGTKIPLRLRFQENGKFPQTLDVQVEVRNLDGTAIRH